MILAVVKSTVGVFMLLPVILIIVSLIIAAVKGGTAGRIVAGVVLASLIMFALLAILNVRAGEVQMFQSGQGTVGVGTDFILVFEILGLLLVAILVLFAMRGGTIGKVVVGILFALILIVFLGRFTMRARNVEIAQREERIRQIETKQVAMIAEIESVWSDGVDQEFRTDVYSTKAAAVRAVAREVVDAIESVAADQAEPLAVRVVQGQVEDFLIDEFKGVLSDSFADIVTVGIQTEDGFNVLLADTDSTFSYVMKNEVRISYNSSTRSSSSFGPEMAEGKITAIINYSDVAETKEAQYSEKMWLTDLSQFASSTDGTEWIVARSSEACLSEEEAINQAMGKACLLVASKEAYNGQYLSGEKLEQLGFVSDRFTQSFYGKSGRIWRAAVLIDVSPEKLQSLSWNVSAESRRLPESMARRFLLLGGIILMICVICWFLNAVTREQFSWTTGKFAILVSVILFIVWFAGSVVTHWYAAVDSMRGM